MKENINCFGIWQAVVKKSTGKTVSNKIYKNLIPTIGRTALAAQIADNYTNSAKITYIAVGNDSTAPSNSDTTLGGETARKAISSKTNTNNEASITTFFASGEATGTHREYGAFGDGSATVATTVSDTGILFSRVSANETVQADETLTLTYKITFN